MEEKLRYVATEPPETEARRDSTPEPLEEVWPCKHLNFGLLTTTMREQISVVLSHVQFAVLCYRSLWKLMRGGIFHIIQGVDLSRIKIP